MSVVYVVAPANLVTGGPELAHQLAHALNLLGQPAAMLYCPFEEGGEVPEPFRRYGARPARLAEIEPGSRIVCPEVYSEFLHLFDGCRIYFWWMSVDHFVLSIRKTRFTRIFGIGAAIAARAWRLSRQVEAHLYQSEYARLYLARHGLHPACALSDYLADEYREPMEDVGGRPREDLIAYNPSKARISTQAVELALRSAAGSAARMVPIENMARAEVRDLLLRAKLYIDFGSHPGKDRLPREAAALGACILVNRRGSAANDIDLPIPAFYKLDENSAEFVETAASRIVDILSNFHAHQPSFDTYRDWIGREPALFLDAVRKIFLPALLDDDANGLVRAEK